MALVLLQNWIYVRSWRATQSLTSPFAQRLEYEGGWEWQLKATAIWWLQGNPCKTSCLWAGENPTRQSLPPAHTRSPSRVHSRGYQPFNGHGSRAILAALALLPADSRSPHPPCVGSSLSPCSPPQLSCRQWIKQRGMAFVTLWELPIYWYFSSGLPLPVENNGAAGPRTKERRFLFPWKNSCWKRRLAWSLLLLEVIY